MNLKSLLPFGHKTNLAQEGGDDPFTSLKREMDRLFDNFTRDWAVPSSFAQSGFLSPKVNVAESEKGLELSAELPGVDMKDIELDLTDGVLTLKAEHKEEKEEKDEKKQYHLIERSSGTFMRRFTLPFVADEDKIEASFTAGVLKVLIPRSAVPEKPMRKIEIKQA